MKQKGTSNHTYVLLFLLLLASENNYQLVRKCLKNILNLNIMITESAIEFQKYFCLACDTTTTSIVDPKLNRKLHENLFPKLTKKRDHDSFFLFA